MAVAIDLGTTTSCIAFWDNQSRLIPITQEIHELPFRIAVQQTDESVLVSDYAPTIATNNAKLISHLKFFIGKDFCDASLDSICKRYGLDTFFASDQPRNAPKNLQNVRHYIALFLARIKHIAETHLGRTVDEAVISIPCMFGIRQREEIKYCAQLGI